MPCCNNLNNVNVIVLNFSIIPELIWHICIHQSWVCFFFCLAIICNGKWPLSIYMLTGLNWQTLYLLGLWTTLKPVDCASYILENIVSTKEIILYFMWLIKWYHIPACVIPIISSTFLPVLPVNLNRCPLES